MEYHVKWDKHEQNMIEAFQRQRKEGHPCELDFDFDLEKARRMEVEIGKFCLNAVSVRREIEQTNKSNYVLHTQFKLLSSSDSW